MDATQGAGAATTRVFGLQVKNLRTYSRGAKQYSVVGKKDDLLTQSTDDIKTLFFDKLDDEAKKPLFFVVTEYEAATELRHKVTVTEADGSSTMTLQELKTLIEA